jgi:Xaa-Pro aminopeptidase
LERNAPIVVDQGAILDDYVSDMTRMVCLGRLSNQQRLVFQAVREAQEAAIDAVRAGVKAHSVDRKARQVLKRFKLDTAFPHSTGHGLGLEIHEQPRVGRSENTRLRSGMVITIEPGAYLEGVGGVRIEDVVLVTATGCEVLTPTPRDVRVL